MYLVNQLRKATHCKASGIHHIVGDSSVKDYKNAMKISVYFRWGDL